LILLNVMMPGMDGFAVLTKRREDLLAHKIPVMFMTSLTSFGDEERGLQLSAADYITEPIVPAVMLARVLTQRQAKQARDWLQDWNTSREAMVTWRMAENDQTQQVSIRALAHLAETRGLEKATTSGAPRAMSSDWRWLCVNIHGLPRRWRRITLICWRVLYHHTTSVKLVFLTVFS
jgi:DNA-binding response OmpR family regulator